MGSGSHVKAEEPKTEWPKQPKCSICGSTTGVKMSKAGLLCDGCDPPPPYPEDPENPENPEK